MILGDFLKANKDIAAAIDDAMTIANWFISHSFALGVLNEEQALLYTVILALILPVITRWTAHYCSTVRLLRLKKAITITVIKHEEELIACAGTKKDAQDKAQNVISLVRDETLWKKLER